MAVSAIRAAMRSHGIARSFWYLAAVAYGIWLLPQSLSTYGDLFDTPDRLQFLIKFLFSFWIVPLSMTLCLDDDSPGGSIDWLLMFDFCQGLFFVIGAYSFFHFDSGFETTLVRSAWGAYFLYYGLLAGAFQLRSTFTHSLAGRFLFRRMALFLLFCAFVDAGYYYGSGSLLETGSWFDIFWSILLCIPLLFAASWNDVARTELGWAPEIQARGQLLGRIPSLVFPILILIFFLIFSVRIYLGQLDTHPPLRPGRQWRHRHCAKRLLRRSTRPAHLELLTADRPLPTDKQHCSPPSGFETVAVIVAVPTEIPLTTRGVLWVKPVGATVAELVTDSEIGVVLDVGATWHLSYLSARLEDWRYSKRTLKASCCRSPAPRPRSQAGMDHHFACTRREHTLEVTEG